MLSINRERQRISVRRARVADLEQLLTIERQCFRAHRFNKRQFQYYLHNQRAIFYVAETGGDVVGYIAGTVHQGKNKRTARVYSMAVLPECRRFGIGSFLLTHFERKAAELKCASVLLEVREHNRPAQAIYRELGYERESSLPDYYGPGKRGLRMRKVLSRRELSYGQTF